MKFASSIFYFDFFYSDNRKAHGFSVKSNKDKNQFELLFCSDSKHNGIKYKYFTLTNTYVIS